MQSRPRDESIDPFSQLERCHRRLEEACDALDRAVPSRDLETVADVAAFLGRQIRRHEDDEDASLFPRLAAKADLADPIARLKEEHEAQGRLRDRLEDALGGRVDDPWKEIAAVADELIRSYRAHIALEEGTVFPAARAALGPDDLAAMQTEMNARRGR